MRLHILSDLHLEFGPVEIPHVEADVTIIAGDLANGIDGIRWIRKNIPDRPVLYVLGNHEFYQHCLPRLTKRIRDLTHGTNITLLENDVIEIAGITFLGATLWTDFALDGDPKRGEAIAQMFMADYAEIKFGAEMRPLLPSDIRKIHHESRAWLEKTASAIKTPKIIITHHAPHPKSISPKFLTSQCNPAFTSDLTDLIRVANAKLWIHGHMHSSADYRVGPTRIINNPHGYDLENVHFRPDFFIEI